MEGEEPGLVEGLEEGADPLVASLRRNSTKSWENDCETRDVKIRVSNAFARRSFD